MDTDLMLTIITTTKDIVQSIEINVNEQLDIDMTIIDMQKAIIEPMIIADMQKITGIQMTEDMQIAIDHQMIIDMPETIKNPTIIKSMIIEKAIIKTVGTMKKTTMGDVNLND